MAFQTLIVAVLVSGCSAYAAWSLMPGAGKRALAAGLWRLPMPLAWRSRLQATNPGLAKAQPLVFHLRKTL